MATSPLIACTGKIFTSKEWITDSAVLSAYGKILDIIPTTEIPEEADIIDYAEDLIVPAFIDLQIYGAGGRLLSAFPDKESLQVLHQHNITGGTAFCLPTVATHPYEIIFQCIDAVRDYWKNGGEGVLGLHVEGPWINPVKRGAHKEEWIFSPSLEQVKELTSYGKDVIKMITLAPECCNEQIVDYLLEEGITVSAGHSNASYEQAMQGFEKIPTATHLFNAMSPLHHRAPGLPGAVMSGRAMASIIPDGHHVDFPIVKIAKAAMQERLYVITDAVTETSIGAYPHEAATDKFESNGILSGSALTMIKAVRNLMEHAAVSLDESLRMVSTYPARLMQLDQKLGNITKGADACFTVLSPELEVRAVFR